MLREKKTFLSTLGVTALIALCCFTPILVISLSALGITALIGYLDYVLLPLLIICIIISMRAYLKYNNECKKCEVKDQSED